MRLTPVDLVGGFYADDALPWSAQDTVNWLPVMAEVNGSRTVSKLRGAPGLTLLGTVGDGPHRGAINVGGTLYMVSGDTLYKVAPNYSSSALGTVPGAARVSMSYNQRGLGYELLVVNGSAGYVYNTSTGVFTKITDEGYPGAVTAAYLDSYLVQAEPFGRFWFHSELADALSYNMLDRYESEASPDRIVTLAVNQFEVVVFNQATTEFFYNAGGATNTFASKRIVIDKGCSGRWTVANIDNSVMWLGNDGVVYRLESGYTARPVSTRAVERAIASEDWANAFALVWEDEGHKVYYLTFPGGRTWGYDVVSGLWTRRQSYGLKRWRANTIAYWDRKWVIGDYASGAMYELDWSAFTEAGHNLVSERVTGVVHGDQNALFANNVELMFDTGHGSTPDHSAMIDYSDDGGRNYVNIRYRDLGAVGEYGKRVKCNRLGRFRNRIYRIRVSSPHKRDLLGAVINMTRTTG